MPRCKVLTSWTLWCTLTRGNRACFLFFSGAKPGAARKWLSKVLNVVTARCAQPLRLTAYYLLREVAYGRVSRYAQWCARWRMLRLPLNRYGRLRWVCGLPANGWVPCLPRETEAASVWAPPCVHACIPRRHVGGARPSNSVRLFQTLRQIGWMRARISYALQVPCIAREMWFVRGLRIRFVRLFIRVGLPPSHR